MQMLTWEARKELIKTVLLAQQFWQGRRVWKQRSLSYVVWSGAPPKVER